MSMNPKTRPHRGQSALGPDDATRLCAMLPEALQRLLLDDSAVVISLCLKPAFLSAAGRRAALALLEIHAARDAAAADVWHMLQRRGRTIH